MKDVKIVIGQRGWVWVGFVEETEKEVTITKARCVRNWGTTKGLGELVNGPLSGTKLDPCGTVRIHPLARVASIDCNPEKWADVLV